MAEFWEEAFKDKREMWGQAPAKSTLLANEFFSRKGIENVLIPGIGYGRNAKPFLESGMSVTGIEISKTAIAIAKEHFGESLNIHYGSVTDMPYDHHSYDGIFCYGLIYLLDQAARHKLIEACYQQLAENGYMIFTAITKEASTYRQGTQIGKDRFEMFGGVTIFFYDRETIDREFGKFGLFEVTEVSENYPFYIIKCWKG